MQAATYELGKAFIEINNARSRFQVCANEKGISHSVKDCLLTNARRLDGVIKDFERRLSPEAVQTLRTGIIDDEVTMQIDCILNMLLSLPKATRDDAEKYVAGLYNVYKLNQ